MEAVHVVEVPLGPGRGQAGRGRRPPAGQPTCWAGPLAYDRELYRERNLIKRAFNKLKHWHRIATRYDRRSLYFLSAPYLVASVIWG